jgi:GNAT superfamily N-acetyltransferase
MAHAIDEIVIRTELKPGDIGYVIHLHGRLYADEYQYGISFESYVAEGLSEFWKQYDPAKNRIWVCEHQNRIIGFLLLMNRGSSAQLRYFIIEPEFRSIGLGRKLMQCYVEFMRSAGYKHSYLWTTHELPAAASLYRRFGFELTEEKPSSAFGKPLTEQKYELTMRQSDQATI